MTIIPSKKNKLVKAHSDLKRNIQICRSVDVIEANKYYSLNGISIGRAAGVTENTPDILKGVVGKYAYSLSSLLSLFDMTNPVPFTDENGEDYIFGYVMNAVSCGGGFAVAPGAKINDGKFDVSLIKSMDLVNIANITFDLWQENDNEHIKRFKTDSFCLQSNTDIPVSLDGENTQLPAQYSAGKNEGCPSCCFETC